MNDPTIYNAAFGDVTATTDVATTTSNTPGTANTTQQDQIMSAVRTVLQVGGTIMVITGHTDQAHWDGLTTAILDIVGPLFVISGFLWGQLKHAGLV
jgi:hypothetical protein